MDDLPAQGDKASDDAADDAADDAPAPDEEESKDKVGPIPTSEMAAERSHKGEVSPALLESPSGEEKRDVAHGTSHPIDEVWRFFHDVPKVAGCLPGAEYVGSNEDGRHLGKVSAKVGPFQASFEGEAAVHYDEEKKSVALEGKGVDRKGASRGKMSMNCLLLPSGDLTGVVVDSDIQLSGTIAQFGRTGLITEVANALVASFVQNTEAALSSAQVSMPRADGDAGAESSAANAPVGMPINGVALFVLAIKSLIRSWFRRGG